ncbi:MAG: gliding motility lipoprotein GldH [Bacteroidales bacterium]|nr:gliding motility lipoprotein GldH [Bacteroidales bacterium]
MKARALKPFAVVCLLTLMAACDSNILFNEERRVDEQGWNYADSLVFNYEADDTARTNLCCIDIRNLDDYPYSNIYFNIKTIYPDGRVAIDTNLQFILAEKNGRWLGRKSGRYVDGRYPFCYFKFPQTGMYQFVVTHAMRDTTLPGIRDVSFVIMTQ